VWSRDGRIAFRRQAGGKDDGVYIVDTKDNSKNQLVYQGAPTVSSWSQDGKYLLLTSQPGRINLLPLSGEQKLIPIGSPHGRSFAGRISPKNKFIAFTSDQNGRPEIWVQPMPPDTGQTLPVSFGGGGNPRWRQDGKELFFVSVGLDSIMRIMAMDVRGDGSFSKPRALFEIKDADPNDVGDYDVSADGQRFLIYMDPKGTEDVPITVILNWWAELRQQP
jgi:Tol biopolymer transport system component